MLRIFIIQTNRRKHGPLTLGSYTRLTLPDKNATKMQTKRPINKLEKADILTIIWNTYPTHFKLNDRKNKNKFFVNNTLAMKSNND